MPAILAWLITLTSRSLCMRIWHDSLVFGPRSSFGESIASSASPISPASPAISSTRHVVHRAFPPHRCRMSIPLSSIARTSFLPSGPSKVRVPLAVWAVICGIQKSPTNYIFNFSHRDGEIKSPVSDRNFLPHLVYRNEGDLGLGDFHALALVAEAFGFDLDVHGDRSITDADSFSIKADEIANESGLVK